MKELTDSNFGKEISKGVVLVDFWAEWCGPCKMLAPILEELSDDYQGAASVCKINVDQNWDTATLFGIMSIPTVIIFKDGTPVEHIIGMHPKERYTFALDKALSI